MEPRQNKLGFIDSAQSFIEESSYQEILFSEGNEERPPASPNEEMKVENEVDYEHEDLSEVTADRTPRTIAETTTASTPNKRQQKEEEKKHQQVSKIAESKS